VTNNVLQSKDLCSELTTPTISCGITIQEWKLSFITVILYLNEGRENGSNNKVVIKRQNMTLKPVLEEVLVDHYIKVNFYYMILYIYIIILFASPLF
jgi:hypothetical protein